MRHMQKGIILEISRFFSVALLGLIIDITLALLLIVSFGFSDVPAAGTGLLAGMLFNYLLHLKWTFRKNQRTASAGHFLQFSFGVGLTFLVRVLVLAGIDFFGWQDLMSPLSRLSLSAAISFIVSYLISRLVFSDKSISHDATTDEGRR